VAADLRIYNANGSLQFGLQNRLFRILTAADVGGANAGTIVAPNAQGGVIDVVATPTSETGRPPAITVSGNNINYNYGGATTRQSMHLVVMEY